MGGRGLSPMFCDCAGSRDDENVFGPGVDAR
jgi:hypothetical protein